MGQLAEENAGKVSGELRECLRTLMSFKGILEGAVKLEDKLIVATELSKVQMKLSKAARLKGTDPGEIQTAIEKVAEFSKKLPGYDNKDFKWRRETNKSLGDAITFTARAIAENNKRMRE